MNSEQERLFATSSKLTMLREVRRLQAANAQLEKDLVDSRSQTGQWMRTANEADIRHMGECELLRREREAEKARADAAEALVKTALADIESLRWQASNAQDQANHFRGLLGAIGAKASAAAQRTNEP